MELALNTTIDGVVTLPTCNTDGGHKSSCFKKQKQFVTIDKDTYASNYAFDIKNFNISSDIKNSAKMKRKTKTTRLNRKHRQKRRSKTPYHIGRRWLLPTPWTIYLMIVLAVEITLINSFVIVTFLQKKNRTPVTILLAMLAFSDMSTAAMMSGLDYFVLKYYEDRHIPHYEGYSIILPYSGCVGLNIGACVGRTFHLISVLITTALCIQKAWVIRFPFNNTFNKKKSTIFAIGIFIMTILIHVPELIFRTQVYGEKKNGNCFNRDRTEELTVTQINEYFHWLIFGIYMLGISLVIPSTFYICLKLTCLRRRLPWKDTTVTQRKHQRSALMVVVICVIFILSEMMNLLVLLNDASLDHVLGKEIRFTFRRYRTLSLEVGFSLNFIVYLTMSEQIRNFFKKFLSKICKW